MADKKKSIDQLLLENDELKLRLAAKEALIDTFRENENKYTAVYNSMTEGLAIHELIYDSTGKAIDYLITDINLAYEKITGLKKKKAVGLKATELYSVREAPYINIYSEVESSGIPQSFESFFPPMDKHFHVSVFSPARGKFVTVFQDISNRKFTEEKLQVTLDRFYLILSKLRNGILLLTRENRVEFVNQHFCEVFDLKESPEDLLNRTSNEIISLIKNKYLNSNNEIERIKEIVKTDAPVFGEDIAMKSGRSYLRDFIPISVGGNNFGRLWSHIDITNRKLVEDTLGFQSHLLSEVHDAVFSSDKDFTITYWNKAAEKMFGWTKEEALGKNSGELLNPKVEFSSRYNERSKLRRTGHWEGEVQYSRKDGTYVFMDVNSTVLKDSDGKDTGNVVVTRDITARKLVEETLKKSEALYRAIGESIDYGIWICDADGKNTYASESYLKLVGLTQEQCSEFGWGDTLHPDDAERTIAAWKECSKTGGLWDIEHRFKGVDGKWHPILARGVPIHDEKGNIISWAGINLDISKIKQTEEALRESEDRFRSIINNSLDVIYRQNLRTGKYEYISPSAGLVVGYSPAELLTLDLKTAMEMVHPDDVFKLTEAINQLEKSGKGIAEYRQRRKNGDYRWLSNHMSLIKDEYGTPLYRDGNIRDITDQKHAEQILKESEERFRTISETVPVLVCVTRLADNIVLFTNELNNKAFAMRGEDILGSQGPDYYCDPADRVKMIELFKKQGFINNFQLKVKKSDGTPFWIMTSVRQINYYGEQALIGASIDITERIHLEQEREQLLHEVESQAAWLNASISSMATGMILYGLDGKAIHMNETAKKLLQEELFFNKTIEERSKIIKWETEDGKPFPPEEIPVKRAFNGETTHNVVLAGTFHENKIWISSNAAPILAPDGKMIGVVASFLDITQSKKAEIALRLSEEHLRVTLNSIGDAVLSVDNLGRIVFLNPVAISLTGWELEEVFGHDVQEIFRIINEQTQMPAENIVQKVLLEGNVVGLSNHSALVAKDGHQIPIEDSAAPIKDQNGNVIGAVLVFHDVSGKRQAEKALQASLVKYKTLFDCLPLGITVSDEQGQIVESNQLSEVLLGLTKEEQEQRKINGQEWQLITTDGMPMPSGDYASVRALKEKRLIENVEMGVIRTDNTYAWINVTAAPIPLDGYGVLIIYSDITARRSMEEKLRESEQKFQALFNLSPLPMILSSVEDGIYHDVNDSFLKVTGFTREEVIGRTSSDLNLFVVHDMRKHILDEIRNKGNISGLACDFRLKNGIVLNCLISSSSVIIKGTVYLLSSIQDMTDFLKTREELKISETRFRMLAENIPDMIVRFDKDLKLLYGNEAVTKRTGRPIEYLTGKSAKEYGASSDSDMNWKKAAKEAIDTGKPCRLEQETTWQGILKVYDALIVPERDEKGKVISIISIARDITEMKKAESILRNSEQRLKYHLENSPLAVVEWDKEFNIIQWSNEAERIFGLTKEETIGVRIDMLNIIYPEDIPLVEKTIKRLTSGKEVKVVSQNRNITKNGNVRECIWYNSVLLDEKGEMSSVMSLIEDVTLLHSTEKELLESRESYRELVTNARSMILKFDNEARFTFVNEFALDFFGYKKEELLGKSVRIIVPETESTGRDLKEMVGRIVENPEEYSINTNENIKSNGEKAWVEWHNKTLFDQSGKKTGHLAIGIDISKRKKAQEALKESERKLRSVLNATQESIYMFDKEGNIVMSNATGIRRLNRKEESEVVLHKISEFMTAEIAKKRLVKISEVFKSGVPLSYEDERESKAYQHNMFPVFKDDEVIFVVTYSTDITEQKRAEISLKQSEDRFRTIAESLTVIVYITKICDSTLTFLNEPFEKSFGYNKSEILGTRMPDIYFFPDDKKFLVDSLKVKGLVENVEIRVKNRDGIPFWIMTSIRKINYMNEPSYLTASIDISETKKAQDQLLRLNRTLDAQSKSSQAMMHSRNEQEYLNEICKIIIEDCGHAMVWVGYAQNDNQKSVKPVAQFGFDQGYIDHMNITWDDSDRGRGPTGTAIKTGKPSICRNMLTDPCFEPWRDAAIKRGYSSSVVLPLKSEGKAFGAISIYSVDPDPFTDSEIDLLTELADDLAYGILFIRLTEYEKEATRAIKENEIRLKELIATKDKFFNIIAHDLKNPFTSLLGASELLYDNISQMSDENIKKLALILNDSAKGGYSILQNLLDWSRSQTGQLKFNPENINLKNIIDENIDNLQLQVNNKEINLKSEQVDDLFITGDKNMINTVLRNLLSNAVKYTSKNGIIRVMVIQDKAGITLTVKDNGIGISKEKVDQLFRLENSLSMPGTAKEQGTGLGLRLCKEFTEKMGGKIWVESKVDAGSEFKFTIPVNGVKA